MPRSAKKRRPRSRSRRTPTTRAAASRWPAWIPCVEILHDLAADEKQCAEDGTTLERVGEEISEQLEFVPRSCACCATCAPSTRVHLPHRDPHGGAARAADLEEPGLADAVAFVAVSKYADGSRSTPGGDVPAMGIDLPRARSRIGGEDRRARAATDQSLARTTCSRALRAVRRARYQVLKRLWTRRQRNREQLGESAEEARGKSASRRRVSERSPDRRRATPNAKRTEAGRQERTPRCCGIARRRAVPPKHSTRTPCSGW